MPDAAAVPFESISRRTPIAWSVVDLEGNQLDGSDRYFELFGYEPRDGAALDVDALTHPEDRELTSSYLGRLVSGEIERYETDKRYMRKDGSTFVGHLTATLIREDGRPHVLLGVIEDVTEQRRAEEALARSESQFRKLFANIEDSVTLIDREGRVAAASGQATTVLGYPSDYWDGRSLFDLAHPDDVERGAAFLSELVERPGETLTAELRARHHDGSIVTIEAHAVNLLDDAEIQAIVVTSRNVTERKRFELALAHARDAALHLAEQRASFVAQVSHELRTPLHAILGLSELLLSRDHDGADRRELAAIHGEARALSRVIDDLLDVSRAEAGQIELIDEDVPVEGLVSSVLEAVAATPAAEGLELRTRIAPDVPEWLVTDGGRLRQVLMNLVGNAVRYTDAGGVTVGVELVDDLIVFHVTDTGRGIPRDRQADIFEPFTQANREPGGTGLGLAIVARIVEAMRGDIMVESEPGAGSTFSVAIPLRVGHRPTAPASPVGDATGGSVLVAEDNEINQLLVSSQLERLGYDCVLVASGEEALDLLGRRDFDAVLMDWQMPGMDGLEATRSFRATERADHRTPIIAMTANAMAQNRQASRDAGMDDFLAKPVGLAALGEVLARWIGPTERPDRLVDESVLAGLVDELGDAAPVVTLVERYLTELDRRLGTIGDGLAAGDLAVAQREAHTLRSTSGLLGADRIAALCRSIEQGEHDDSTGAELERAARDTSIRLRDWRAARS